MADLVEEKQHARLSPSSAKRWMVCPGSVKLIEALNIEETPSKYAAEGTVAHEVHELCLVNNQKASKWLGRTISADGMKFKVNQNMVDAVQSSLDYIDNQQLEWQCLKTGKIIETLVEVRSCLKHLDVPGLDGGTSDVVLLYWNGHHLEMIEVFDYKHGAGVAVEAKENPQAMCYALGVLNKYYPDCGNIDVKITISQPRAHHPEGPIRSWLTCANDLLIWQNEELIPKAKATHEDDGELVPSDEGCRFCKAAPNCSKLYERTQEVALVDFENIIDEDCLPNVETLTAEQKTYVMKHADIIRSFLSNVEEHVKSEIDQGSKDYQSHYKLVRKSSRRKFTEDALDELSSPLLDHLEMEDIFEEKPKSITEIERILKKKVGKNIAADIMSDITFKSEGDLMVVPITDKRKEVNPTVISDFKDLD